MSKSLRKTVLSLAGAVFCLAVPLARVADAQEDAVKAAYKSLETAARNGDGQLWLTLQSKSRLADVTEQNRQSILKGAYRDPSIRYEPIVVRVLGNNAVLIGKFIRASQPGAKYSYHTVKYVLEDNQWKITAEAFSETPVDPISVWALLPPEDGSFSRARSPWSNIAYAGLNTKAFRPADLPWKMQATADESFLYIRFEAASPLPAPGSEIHKPPTNTGFVDPGTPPGPPSMVMKLGGNGPTQKTVEFKAETQVLTRSTFDASGKANSYRYFVTYYLGVRQPTRGVQVGDAIFGTSIPDSPGLIDVHDRFLDLKIPWKAIGWSGGRPTSVQIQEFNSLPQILPYQVSELKR